MGEAGIKVTMLLKGIEADKDTETLMRAFGESKEVLEVLGRHNLKKCRPVTFKRKDEDKKQDQWPLTLHLPAGLKEGDGQAYANRSADIMGALKKATGASSVEEWEEKE